MKNIYLIPNVHKDKNYHLTRKVSELLVSCGAEISMPVENAESGIANVTFRSQPMCGLDLVVVIGGDGSFIDASSVAIDNDIPILGINLGKVGYLSEIEPDEISVLRKIFDGEYRVDEKMLLSCECETKDGVKYSTHLAVNDVVVSHTSYLGISDFAVLSNEGGVRYRADGIVVSTPAGSTAYSLSVGGPILSHDAAAMIVTPIAPHSLFNRSIVFGANDKIKIKNTGQDMLNVSVDGRCFAALEPNAACSVYASDKKLKVLTFKNNSMFSTLFGKMKLLEEII